MEIVTWLQETIQPEIKFHISYKRQLNEFV